MSPSPPKNSSPIFVLKPVAPPMAELQAHLDDIWHNRQFTNSGPKHEQLESSLCNFLAVPHTTLVSNGTLALMAAIAALNLRDGEVITTPYTFVASSHCLEPFNLKPRFVDIDPDTLTIDPKAVAAAIQKNTKAIMAVHVYGNPCAMEALDDIAQKHNLKIIYDAAHAFGIKYKGKSILDYGDVSACSFHATKAFHTVEGGAVFSPNKDVHDNVLRYRNFGIANDGNVIQQGLNTKMSEIHAAVGLVNLNHYQSHVEKRAKLYARYREALHDIPWLHFVSLDHQENPNYNYCPVLIENKRDALFDTLAENNIFTRKYFYPLLTDMPAYADHKAHFSVASRVAEQVLCLPIYSDMTDEEQHNIIMTIKNF